MKRLAGAGFSALFLILPLALLGAGCRTLPEPVTVVGPSLWSGLGVTLSLPEGIWEVQQVSSSPGVVVFRGPRGGGELVLFRSERPPGSPTWLALRELLVELRAKREMEWWTIQSGDGTDWRCTRFLLEVDGRRVPAAAGASQTDGVAYQLVTWRRAGGSDAAGRALEGVIRTVRMAPEGRSGVPR